MQIAQELDEIRRAATEAADEGGRKLREAESRASEWREAVENRDRDLREMRARVEEAERASRMADDTARELDEAAILEQSKSAEGYNPLYAIQDQVTAEEELKVLVMLSDEGDGTYLAEFEPSVAGEYKVHIEFNGTFDGPAGPIRGSPFTFTAQEAYEYVQAHPKDFSYLEGADPDQRALNEINSFDGPLLIADIVSKIKNIRDFAGKKKRGLAKLDPQNYDDMARTPRRH